MFPYIKRSEQINRPPLTMSPLPWNFGDDGRYLYVLNCGDQTVSVIDCNSDTVISTVTLTASKDFGSIFYRPHTKQVLVVGATGGGWLDVIDADPDSVNFNTVVTSVAWTLGTTVASVGTYLPFPFDYFTTGGSSAALPLSDAGKLPYHLSKDGRYKNVARLGGHSNSFNSHIRHISSEISVNKLQHRICRPNGTTNVPYGFEANPQACWYQDLNGVDFPVTKFGNFFITFTGTSAFLGDTSSVVTSIAILSTLGGSNNTYGIFAPNAPDRYFAAYQTTNNIITVLGMDYANVGLTDLGDVTKTGLGTNEAGTKMMLYNTFNGKIYALANASTNVTGVNKVHVFDPTASPISNIQVGTITVGELKSASTVSRNSQTSMTLNRLPCWEYPNVRM